MKIIDCHCHLSFLSPTQLKQTVDQSDSNRLWVMGGYEPKEWGIQKQYKKLYPDKILTSFGLHPWFIKSNDFNFDRDLEAMMMQSAEADLIGEIGLDYAGDKAVLNKELQIKLFTKQIELGFGKPFVLHIVQAHGDTLIRLRDYKIKGYIHSFSGSIEVALEYLKHNFLLSFGPRIFEASSKRIVQVIQEIPLDKILIESDSPSRAGENPHCNEILLKVTQEVAKIKQVSVEDLQKQVEDNFMNLISENN